VLFDLEAKRFYIFGLVLYPQDFIYLTGLLVVSALSLFLFTAVAGRLWCGYACPQTVYSELFMWIERKVEGDRSARMRLDAGNLSLEKLVKKTYKHIIWLGLSIWTGFTFVGYFTPIHDLGMAFFQTRMGSWEVFWVFFYGFVTYGNAGFMREQVCKYMCPYARFQSVMFDKDTLVVTYDPVRGEPRGARRKSEQDGLSQTMRQRGDCIDCGVCVHVCPTGIDIRKGMQYECIGCAACIDGCNEVMDKLSLPRGLIRYSTENAITGKIAEKDILARMVRPRILIYASILLLIVAGLFTALHLRTPFKADILRDRGSLARELGGGVIENNYRIQIINAAEHGVSYHLSATGLPGLQVSPSEIRVDAASTRLIAVAIQAPGETVPAGSSKIVFEIEALDGSASVSEKTTFYGPMRVP
jgi:cytochrome c oxidase accessory protein FixG